MFLADCGRQFAYHPWYWERRLLLAGGVPDHDPGDEDSSVERHRTWHRHMLECFECSKRSYWRTPSSEQSAALTRAIVARVVVDRDTGDESP